MTETVENCLKATTRVCIYCPLASVCKCVYPAVGVGYIVGKLFSLTSELNGSSLNECTDFSRSLYKQFLFLFIVISFHGRSEMIGLSSS